jgi:hypothetical protein
MTFRLILVSLVAALGFTIPGAPEIESWVASTQDWMNARFAGCNTRKLQSSDHGIASDHGADGLLACQSARLNVAVTNAQALSSLVKNSESLVRNAPASRVRPVKFVPKCIPREPLEIGERPATDIAFRLDFRNDRVKVVELEGPPAPSSSRLELDTTWALGKAACQLTACLDRSSAALAQSLPRFSFIVASHLKKEPGLRAKAGATELAEDRTSKTQERSVKFEKAAAPQCRTIALESFGAMEQSESLYFAGELPQLLAPLAAKPDIKPCSPQGRRAKVAPVAVCSPIAAFALTVVDDVYEESNRTMRPADGGFVRPVATMTVTQQPPVAAPETRIVGRKSVETARMAPKSAIKPRFEPLEVGEDRCADISLDLKPRRDGSKIAAVPAIAAVAPVRTVLPLPTTKAGFVAPRPAPDLSRAVKLTREAVYAWVEVLGGPAIVTIAQPSTERVE